MYKKNLEIADEHLDNVSGGVDTLSADQLENEIVIGEPFDIHNVVTDAVPER